MNLAAKIKEANLALFLHENLNSVEEFFTPDYVTHLTDDDLAGGHDMICKILRMYLRAFADIQLEVEILIESKDRIGWQRTFRANHKDNFKGFPGTGRPLMWRDMVISQFRDGLIAEEWLISDLAERLLLARK